MIQYGAMMSRNCLYGLMKKRNILLAGLLAFLFTASVPCAGDTGGDYDRQWIRRSAQSRLQIVNRAVTHYARALQHYKRMNLDEADRFAKDALKVEPEFPKALLLRSLILEEKGSYRKAEQLAEKSRRVTEELEMNVLDEQRYLSENIERLMEIHDPPQTYKRIVLFLLFSAGISFIMLLLAASGLFTAFAMSVRRLFHLRPRTPEPPTQQDLLIGPFPGDEEESRIPWYVHFFIYSFCYLFCFVVTYIIHVPTIIEFVLYSLVSGSILSFLVYHIFFSDTVQDFPQKFGGFR